MAANSKAGSQVTACSRFSNSSLLVRDCNNFRHRLSPSIDCALCGRFYHILLLWLNPLNPIEGGEDHKDTKITKKNIKILCVLCVFVVLQWFWNNNGNNGG